VERIGQTKWRHFWLAIAGLSVCAATAIAADGPGQVDKRTAITQGLKLLKQSGAVYIDKRKCFSCHHQTLPMMAAAAAGERGFPIDTKAIETQGKFAAAFFTRRIKKLERGERLPGGPYTAGYGLLALAAAKYKPDKTTDAMIAYLLKQQKEDGHWSIPSKRPPLEYTRFTSTALSLRGLQLFGRPKQKDEIARRIQKAVRWIISTEASDNEARTFALFGLHWAQAPQADIQKATASLLSSQREDGGWAQLPKMSSDAYATGQALTALLAADAIDVKSDAYRKGVSWLMNNRKTDGSWQVKTRSKPIQVYFESGFPHKKDQFISICATSWAVMALVEGTEPQPSIKQDADPR